ncbi:MAG: arylsulfatase [Bryobacteraceae bacterium]
MNRRNFLVQSLAATAVAAHAQPKKPNVVIFLADDLGWADVGFHGSEIRTPNLDRLASESVQLEHFHAFPVCSPTRSGLMTGRSPMRLGVIYTVLRPWEKYGLPIEEHLMPQSFQAAGYETAITGKWHLGHSRKKFMPNSRGFDHSYGHVNGAIDYFTHERDGGLDWHRDGKSVREEGYSTDLLAAEAVRLIKGRNRAKPMFLYMPFNAPHAPLQAPQKWIDEYAGISDPKRRTFAAMVTGLDAAIGRVLRALDDEGMAKDTIVLMFSDNGGPTNLGARNTPLRGAKASTFEGGLRVPAMLRWPGHLPAGEKRAQVMTVLDVFPTLAAAAGVKPHNKLPFDGKNMWPSIRSGKVEKREDLFFAVESDSKQKLAVRHGDWKLVREISLRDQKAVNYLFQLEQDPSEKNDVASQNPGLVKDLVARLGKWQTLHPKDGVRASEGPPTGWAAPKQYAEAAT